LTKQTFPKKEYKRSLLKWIGTEKPKEKKTANSKVIIVRDVDNENLANS